MTQVPTRTARDVAAAMFWNLDTVYVNRRRSIAKVALGEPLGPGDLPVGAHTPVGLRWTDAELGAFLRAHKPRRRQRRSSATPREGS